jgi:rare lipoprotein A
MLICKAGVLSALVMLVAACAHPAGPVAPAVPVSLPSATAPVAAVPPEPSPSRAPAPLSRETGTAAWYGLEFQGKKTASGEVFDMNGLSAAHRTLPLGTVIRVTNLENGKSIDTRVTDRGPFSRNRILDLSYGAARELGFADEGTTRVQIEALTPAHEPAHYTVQAAAYTEEENARLLKSRLSKKFEVVTIVPYETNVAKFYLVRVGSYATEDRAELVAVKLTHEGLEPVVLRKD